MKSAKAPSQRQLRVSEEVRHVIGKMLVHNDLFIEGLKPGFVMVTEVTISPDLAHATVYIQAIGDVNTDEQIALLNAHKGAFRYQVGKQVKLRIVPDLIFKSDSSFSTSKHINDLLNSPRVKADIEKEIDED